MTSFTSQPSWQHMDVEAFNELDDILDDLRSRYDETPQWEFCEGFMAALVCCRRRIEPAEYLPELLGIGGADDGEEQGSFASDAQRERFIALWSQRMAEVTAALDADVTALDDDLCYQPEVMDVRGMAAELPAEEREAMGDEELPAFAQVWALGFMFAVETWPEEWAPPRDKEAAELLDVSLQAIVGMTEDDEGKPTISPLGDDGPPSVSLGRLNYFGEAIWAVYDLREVWRSLGPRVEQVFKANTPGRNDPCYCGSGKKYKKCHGAG
ncbi:MAG: UPF0149 family protein [Bdellovibrionales bacterium]|nr:UPF0149 family protein [Ramlibacter sp.]